MADPKQVRAGMGILVLRDGKVLLGKRHDDPEKASSALHGEGHWTMPGGKLDFGDTFLGGAVREMKEETGLDLVNPRVFCVNNERVADAHFVTVGVVDESVVGEPQVMEPDEITEWRWFPLDQLPTPLFAPSAKILRCYQEQVLTLPED
ncbi:MAG: NUDIX domain-containing protein [Patescibacteria group bacterium]